MPITATATATVAPPPSHPHEILKTQLCLPTPRLHRPHPANIMKTYQLELIEEHLRERGCLT